MEHTPAVLFEAIKLVFVENVHEYFFISYIKWREGSQIQSAIKWMVNCVLNYTEKRE